MIKMRIKSKKVGDFLKPFLLGVLRGFGYNPQPRGRQATRDWTVSFPMMQAAFDLIMPELTNIWRTTRFLDRIITIDSFVKQLDTNAFAIFEQHGVYVRLPFADPYEVLGGYKCGFGISLDRDKYTLWFDAELGHPRLKVLIHLMSLKYSFLSVKADSEGRVMTVGSWVAALAYKVQGDEAGFLATLDEGYLDEGSA